MFPPLTTLSLLLLLLIHLSSTTLSPPDTIPHSTREHWMRAANSALNSPCPFEAFGCVIVNHSDTSNSPHGELVCSSQNQIRETGNPTLHGEVAAINECVKVLGERGWSAEEIKGAWEGLSLYTNGEPCPMCASAIRYSNFAECIFGTTIPTLIKKGWKQISITSQELFDESGLLPGKTRLIGGVLTEETDPLYSWQFDGKADCPVGCQRGVEEHKGKGWCLPKVGRTATRSNHNKMLIR
ncbi:putative tRNA-specific adenosine deaminase 2 [Glarea lozoyensis 74030]|uniref:Putative tRNA-specific adenosine deaminase 2 n=1 Tax=Glarea lozoyensis (strain ATCC 74030 / MF5533) TaxID=1104152 RepID=H0ECP4_GLAL7|nr:putative tRNA-specific adenosine deaminase 2 [Glarea lozoyensis 74030]